METPENLAPKSKSLENDGPENPGRRGFLRGVLGGTVAGALGVIGLNKYAEQEKRNNDFFEYFKDEEENLNKANEAANMLIQEMKVANIQRVKLTGTGSSNDRVDILRDFLTRHLNSRIGYSYPFKNNLIATGFYTVESLTAIVNASYAIANPTYSSTPSDKDGGYSYDKPLPEVKKPIDTHRVQS